MDRHGVQIGHEDDRFVVALALAGGVLLAGGGQSQPRELAPGFRPLTHARERDGAEPGGGGTG